MKIRCVGAELFREDGWAEGRTDRHDETNSRFFRNFANAAKRLGGLSATYHRQNPTEYNLHLTETAKY